MKILLLVFLIACVEDEMKVQPKTPTISLQKEKVVAKKVELSFEKKDADEGCELKDEAEVEKPTVKSISLQGGGDAGCEVK